MVERHTMQVRLMPADSVLKKLFPGGGGFNGRSGGDLDWQIVSFLLKSFYFSCNYSRSESSLAAWAAAKDGFAKCCFIIALHHADRRQRPSAAPDLTHLSSRGLLRTAGHPHM